MLAIYHNPRCSKSRASLKILEDSGLSFEVKSYLTDGLSESEVESIIAKLGVNLISIFRTKEVEFKENGLSKSSSKEDLLTILLKVPKLLERPIIISETEAVIGRPVENTIDFVKKTQLK
ncbi:MAG: arsenate reductase (glutaredoxin) [Candidatus Cloacimonadota bacterium]|nr:MAG: arsenate reductase (glutaredoxin) [Candidatus Cloacimonadota bacterium]